MFDPGVIAIVRLAVGHMDGDDQLRGHRTQAKHPLGSDGPDKAFRLERQAPRGAVDAASDPMGKRVIAIEPGAALIGRRENRTPISRGTKTAAPTGKPHVMDKHAGQRKGESGLRHKQAVCPDRR